MVTYRELVREAAANVPSPYADEFSPTFGEGLLDLVEEMEPLTWMIVPNEERERTFRYVAAVRAGMDRAHQRVKALQSDSVEVPDSETAPQASAAETHQMKLAVVAVMSDHLNAGHADEGDIDSLAFAMYLWSFHDWLKVLWRDLQDELVPKARGTETGPGGVK